MPRPPKAVTEALRWLASQGGKARRRSLSPEERQAAASKAGHARARKLTRAERRAIAKKAADARWRKKGGRS